MKEWYMMNSPSNVGGYESEAISSYAQSNFDDVLTTNFSDTAILYDSKMKESKTIQCVIQGNIANTQLSSLERKILCSIGTLKSGMYVLFEGDYWLITSRVGNNKCYEKAIMTLCNWNLKWQNSVGDIISRYIVVRYASKYNDGEDGNATLMLPSDQLSVQAPIDEDTKAINRNTKFFIDYMDDNKVYTLSNPSNVAYNYGDKGGVTAWIVKECNYSPTEQDLEHGVCDYFEPKRQESDVDRSMILTRILGKNNIKIGIKRNYSLSFFDENDNEIDFNNVNFECKLSDYEDDIEMIQDGTTISLLCKKPELIGKNFNLQIYVDSKLSNYINIDITSLF